ncbi:MAG: LysE family transporter [Pyrodictiaceae archaeon]
MNILQRGDIHLGNSLSLGSSPLEAVIAGTLFTGGNPYFLAWWITIGLPLIRGAARNGATGFIAMYSSHVWIDYVWLAALAGLSGLLSKIAAIYAWLLIGLAAMLLYFAASHYGYRGASWRNKVARIRERRSR